MIYFYNVYALIIYTHSLMVLILLALYFLSFLSFYVKKRILFFAKNKSTNFLILFCSR